MLRGNGTFPISRVIYCKSLFMKCQTDIRSRNNETKTERYTPHTAALKLESCISLNSVIHAPLLGRLLHRSFFTVM